jgi:hypothetical protein
MQSDEPSGACALLSTSFGFGPVSKAVTIAREIRDRAPRMQIHYIGAGIDYEFAERSGRFDRLTRVDTDSREALQELVPLLREYTFVVSVLNFDLLPVWPSDHPPLYVVDSLAWLWPTPPPGLENAAAYFVQAYLVPPQRLEHWRDLARLVIVGPIRPALNTAPQRPSGTAELLVNFSGCANPFAQAHVFRDYVDVLSDAVLRHAARFQRVTICCNDYLSAYLRPRLSALRGDVVVGHLSHDDFIEALERASILLSSPGITTTLEADALAKPIRFLLPQNYSQALMAEGYRVCLGDRSGMAFSRFSPHLEIRAGLPEREGVDAVLRNLSEILERHRDDVRDMLDELITDAEQRGALQLPTPACEEWRTAGQQVIVDHVLGEGMR